MEKLEKEYQRVCNAYVQEFCKKHDCKFKSWFDGVVGASVVLDDCMIIPFHDLIYDINSDQPRGRIISWWDNVLEFPYNSTSYFEYCKNDDNFAD